MTTSDGGAHWTDRDFQAPTLEAVDLDGRRRAVAVGGGGLIVSSGDGGATWQRRDSGTSTLNYDVSFCDAQHGWVLRNLPNSAAWLSYLSSTSDGGVTWQTQRFTRAGETSSRDGFRRPTERLGRRVGGHLCDS